jgi:hypothetical protein
MASTKDVLDHHLKCFGEGDLKGILSDYARSAVMSRRKDHSRGPTRSGRCSRRWLESSENLAQPSA